MMNVDRALNGLLKLAIPLAVVAGVALSVVAVVNTITQDSQNSRAAADRRAFVQRGAELNLGAMAPGSMLSCLDAGAGDDVEAACEAKVFADPGTAAGAVAYTAARISLLAEAYAAQPSVLAVMAGPRRAIELDRYGIAAHVLATRDGCTPENCAAFAFLRDTTALKANLKARVYDQYVSRYAAAWSKPEAEKHTPVAAVQPDQRNAPGAPVAAVPGEPSQPTGVPVSSKYDFPSSASIPPVSIMNTERVPPKAAQPKTDSKAEAKPDEDAVPVPPKRPQTQAPTQLVPPQAR
ncbi:MAG TPA: hypothetical protein VGM57_14685 [Pseudolabrys sp.]